MHELDGFELPTPKDEYDIQLLESISSIGWYCTQVFGDKEGPGFSYTIGHHLKLGQPEVILVGLPGEFSYTLLSQLAAKLGDTEEPLVPHQPYDDIVAGLPVVFIPVEFAHYSEYLGYACWFYASLDAAFPALQMVWPDEAGHFPWDDGYDERYHAIQPLLGPVPPLA